jgi:hypothetical protein
LKLLIRFFKPFSRLSFNSRFVGFDFETEANKGVLGINLYRISLILTLAVKTDFSEHII